MNASREKRRRRRVADVKQPSVKEHNDMKAFKWFYNCLRFTGLIPFSVEHPYFIYKIIFCLLFLSIVEQIYYCFTIWTIETKDVSTDILNKLAFIFDMLFAILCTMGANFNIRKWREFAESLKRLEELVTECGFRCDVKKSFMYVHLSFIYIVVAVEHTVYFTCRVEEDVWNRVKQTFVWMMFYFYTISLAVFTSFLAHLVKRRCLYLIVMVTTRKEYASKAMAVCEQIRRVVICTNRIFRWHWFFLVGNYVVLVLAAVSNVIVTGDYQDSGIYFFTGYSASLVMLLMSCDALEKSGKKIIKTCYMLHESVGNESIKEELFLLATYAEQWKPSLSAAGFYDLNQTTLSTLFEAIITYLVIIIQFNLALV